MRLAQYFRGNGEIGGCSQSQVFRKENDDARKAGKVVVFGLLLLILLKITTLQNLK